MATYDTRGTRALALVWAAVVAVGCGQTDSSAFADGQGSGGSAGTSGSGGAGQGGTSGGAGSGGAVDDAGDGSMGGGGSGGDAGSGGTAGAGGAGGTGGGGGGGGVAGPDASVDGGGGAGGSDGGDDDGGSDASAGGSGGSAGGPTDAGAEEAPPCNAYCSSDFHSIVDCHGNVVQTCGTTDECDVSIVACRTACEAVVANRQSQGCEYFATNMDSYADGACFAAFVANTWSTPAHLSVEYAGQTLSLASFARIPSGTGSSLSYSTFDPVAGLAPGQVAVLFLAGSPSATPTCPVTPAVPTGSQLFGKSGVGNSFHIVSDVPVAAYQMNPYGGGAAAVTGASLLLPTTAWDTNYLAVTAAPYDVYAPSMNIVAAHDGTVVTMRPTVAVSGGNGLPSGAAGAPYTFTLNQGQQAQLTQQADLVGSVIQSSKPIGLMAGQRCLRAPAGVAYCDHAEQMIPPVRAIGNEYVAVMFRPRLTGDEAIWRVVGLVDGTQLSYSAAVGGPATLAAGQTVNFVTDQPFVVSSQDALHPFMLFAYMSGSTSLSTAGYGDPDFVLGVPPAQYLSDYVFFTDPTYPETDLVVVRAKNDGVFFDVTLDCAGTLGGWQTVGNYEWTRVDLVRHDFQNVGGCSNGRHQISSKGRFGLWVWGWGSPETTTFTQNVSYGYPAGMNVHPINGVVIAP